MSIKLSQHVSEGTKLVGRNNRRALHTEVPVPRSTGMCRSGAPESGHYAIIYTIGKLGEQILFGAMPFGYCTLRDEPVFYAVYLSSIDSKSSRFISMVPNEVKCSVAN
jgi:TRAP-type mannitol/chloroaromatic compound transport system substrate-binding protein